MGDSGVVGMGTATRLLSSIGYICSDKSGGPIFASTLVDFGPVDVGLIRPVMFGSTDSFVLRSHAFSLRAGTESGGVRVDDGDDPLLAAHFFSLDDDDGEEVIVV